MPGRLFVESRLLQQRSGLQNGLSDLGEGLGCARKRAPTRSTGILANKCARFSGARGFFQKVIRDRTSKASLGSSVSFIGPSDPTSFSLTVFTHQGTSTSAQRKQGNPPIKANVRLRAPIEKLVDQLANLHMCSRGGQRSKPVLFLISSSHNAIIKYYN